MKNKLNIKLTIILLASVLFISCLEIDTTINFSNDNSGLWVLNYKVMQETAYLTPGTELRGFNYFPLSEEDIKDRIDGIAGLEIISISSNSNIIYKEFFVEISFENTNDIQFFFNTYSENILYTINLAEDGVFEMIINNPFPEAENTDTLNLISGLYSDKKINIAVVLPGIVKESNQGVLSDNPSEANLNLTIKEVFNITEPINWVVKYE